MGLITNLLRRFMPSEQRSDPAAAWKGGGFSTLASIAGFDVPDVAVNERTAMTVDAVWSAVDVITSAMLSLPIHVIDDATYKKQPDHPASRLLRDEPNDDMTPASFMTAMMINALLAGRGYAFIEKRGAMPVGLWPLAARCTQPIRKNGLLSYVTEVNGKPHMLRPDQVLDIPALTFDGLSALNPVVYLARELGLSIVATKYASKAFANGGQVGGIIETPPMSPDAQKAFIESWKRNYVGLENALKVAALPAGWKFTKNESTPENQQLMQMRVHQVRVVARIFKVPPPKLQDLERAAFKNIEELNIAFRQDCIGPWAVRFEQEYNRKLLLESERTKLYIRFNLDAMLRADTAVRFNAHNIAIQGGWKTRNEVRALENLPPIEGGDTPLQPLNMGPSSPTGGGNPDKPKIDPADEDEEKSEEEKSEDARRSQENIDLLAATTRRALTKEIKAVQRAAKKHARDAKAFEEWALGFYAHHESLVTEAFTPVVAAARLTTDAATIAAAHVRESITAVMKAYNTADLEALATDWTMRPLRAATRII